MRRTVVEFDSNINDGESGKYPAIKRFLETLFDRRDEFRRNYASLDVVGEFELCELWCCVRNNFFYSLLQVFCLNCFGCISNELTVKNVLKVF